VLCEVQYCGCVGACSPRADMSPLCITFLLQIITDALRTYRIVGAYVPRGQYDIQRDQASAYDGTIRYCDQCMGPTITIKNEKYVRLKVFLPEYIIKSMTHGLHDLIVIYVLNKFTGILL
jgi:hypothetical protein